MINRFVVNDDNIILLQDLPNDLQSLVINNVNIVPLFVFPLQLKIFLSNKKPPEGWFFENFHNL